MPSATAVTSKVPLSVSFGVVVDGPQQALLFMMSGVHEAVSVNASMVRFIVLSSHQIAAAGSSACVTGLPTTR